MNREAKRLELVPAGTLRILAPADDLCKVVEDASICKVPAGTNRPAVPVVRGVWSACS
ncbi:MAG: hypothetical protein ACI8TQ_000303 [Planctomycetota bacterium]|jgi:hypothetical protein